ncbi:protein NETWORKED 2A-like [Gossypium australe]|uniref:Protein NETWORKED 2A-like n=1 Tax=Gossypium australe TaxID=47621 RepID=A0A5B6UIS2_9ROSI|nr:protein NETWORKED 2A-like [Gossypium australe]
MMLQKVASNAYSWWWASHIRTKQSKWLEQNLHDVEEKVSNMLEIIDDDGDSFAQRANMYYRKRPELLAIVEDTYRAYRALAERFDYLSRDLQSANRTIATVFPDQVPYSLHDEDDENSCLVSTSSSLNKSKSLKPGSRVPSPKTDFRSQSMLLLRKGQLKKAFSSAQAALSLNSGLSKEEALEEINKLQKEILEMQTERELVKNSYEQGYNKLCEIENDITEKQKRIYSLQDEYDIRSAIDDNEARILMANRVLKTCQESLVKLQETHEQSTEEGRVESKRIKKVNEAFEALRKKFNSPQTDQEKQKKASSARDVDNMVYEFNSAEKGREYMELLRKEIEEKLELDSSSSLTMSQLADKIDDLVQRVVNMETAVFSENASVKRLKSDADELQEHVKSLEEDEEVLAEGSDSMEQRISVLEGELSGVKELLKTIIEQNNSLKAHFTAARCDINHLSVNLHAVKMDEEVENAELSEVGKPKVDAKPNRKTKEYCIELVPRDSPALDTGSEMEEKDEDVSAEEIDTVDSESRNKFDFDSTKDSEVINEFKNEKKSLSKTPSCTTDTENPKVETEEEELPNWRKLYLSGLDEREKVLLDEYSSVLHNYKDVRKKLKEVDQKNRDSFYELASQIKELKSALAARDEQIQSSRQHLSFIDENKDGNLSEYEASHAIMSPESTLTESIQASPVAAGEGKGESIENPGEGEGESIKKTGEKSKGDAMQARSLTRSRSILTIEDKIRSDIDELLEENLAFWLRFSTCFHQIQKYQNSVKDLKAELSKMRERKKQEAGGKQEPVGSEARPIYAHFREIKTELTLWLENNAVLKDEVQCRYSSLCNIQEEIERISNVSGHEGEPQFNRYQAAKFQGEIINMKQENNKVSNELNAGFDCVKQLKEEVENLMVELDKEIEAATSKNQQSVSRSRSRIPLRSFLFGIKLKNKWQQKGPSMFACGHPTLQRQYSYLTDPTDPS